MKKIHLGHSGKFAIIDDEDYLLMAKYRWCITRSHNTAYATRSVYNKYGHRTSIGMHQMILGKREGLVIDHINRDGLDNRRENLRHISQLKNIRSRRAASHTSIGTVDNNPTAMITAFTTPMMSHQ